jgi:hypothetical protein
VTDDPVAARAAAYRAEARRSHAGAFAAVCLGLFWLAGVVLVAVLVVKLWEMAP